MVHPFETTDRPIHKTSFPLRLPAALREHATLLANRDGVSLNHFISLAVAEKITRLETDFIKP
jgi:predicted HicB family RNase H-like nuclease